MMPPISEPQKRLRIEILAVIDARGFSRAALASKIAVPESAVHHIITGSHACHSETLQRVEAGLRVLEKNPDGVPNPQHEANVRGLEAYIARRRAREQKYAHAFRDGAEQ